LQTHIEYSASQLDRPEAIRQLTGGGQCRHYASELGFVTAHQLHVP
jgi:hypothetical protein